MLLSGPFGFTYSDSSFLFSLRNKDNLAPFIANIKQGMENKALYPANSCGPWFGFSDILVYDHSNCNNKSFSDFGQSYQLPPGYVQGSKEAKNLLAGAYNFSTSEIEVFY